MALLRVSRAARRDVIEIWDKIAGDSIANADKMYDRLMDSFRALGSTPGLGRLALDFPGVRQFPTGNYVIYYRVVHSRVIIARVIHGMRDQKKAFRAR